MSLFKKLALVGAVSTVMFLGLAVGGVSADGGHDHDHDHAHHNECFNEATGTIDLSKCPMIWTGNGWYVYPNQYTGFHNPYNFYNPYFYNPYVLYNNYWANPYYGHNNYNWWGYSHGYPVQTTWYPW
jgi:hypothetical protein